jgi:hypothetical protein
MKNDAQKICGEYSENLGEIKLQSNNLQKKTKV